jgi:hypothetical protein
LYLIVSKAELLDGIEDDDDEIEPTELPSTLKPSNSTI